MQASGGEGRTEVGVGGTNCEACHGKHRPHTCKVVRRATRGRKRRSPLEAVENALSYCAPGPRMLRTSCELCLAKDRKIAALERRLINLQQMDEEWKWLDEESEQIDEELKQLDEELKDDLKQLDEESSDEVRWFPPDSPRFPHAPPLC